MIKKTLAILSVSAFFFTQAQNVSVVKNTIDVYSGSPVFGNSKYNAMAGATGALGGDATSLLNNPAGLGVAIASDISVTGAIQNYKNESALAGKTNTYSQTTFDVGNVGGVASFQLLTEKPWKFVTLGANYSSQSIDDYVESPGNANISFSNTTNQIDFSRHAYDRTGSKTKLGLGVGANYNNSVFLGMGINFHGAQISQADTAEFLNTDLTTGQSQYEQFSKQYTPYTESASGFSANFGVIGKINNMIRLGVALETPTWWGMDRVYDYYNDNSGSDGSAQESRTLTTPMKATLSGAIVPNKNFAVNVDVSAGLGKPRYKVQGDAETELNDFFQSYKTQAEVKVGAEYRIKMLRLRAGYGFASNPLDSFNVSTYNSNGDTVSAGFDKFIVSSRNTLGLGAGLDFKSFFIDAAYQHIASNYSNPFLKGNADYNSQYFSTYNMLPTTDFAVSDVKNNRNNVTITLGWKF